MTAGGGHEVEPGEIRGYRDLAERQAQHFKTIAAHAREKGGDTSGYTGLLALLAPAVTGVVELYGETLKFASKKMDEVGAKLEDTAKRYETNEQESQSEILTIGNKVDSATPPPTPGGA
ncbi:hypothetical protein [Prauserella rugosa]|uniref:Excreted virulence factor EspC (Type VII ESX diderm) n=1 Tax=Prauserella rugosa TaxID=43354 RepID=A0A660CBF0_9PSEU|nr:hypothetical protein [Prauserella rugosa]KMS85998.1 hypothetical protein ACZ91_39265 [Streptomyces regensis]TWH20802.1 hypothetical protein JD82_02651 [Prauserella rugosa]